MLSGTHSQGSHRLAVLSYLDGRIMSPEVEDQSKRKAAIMFSNMCDHPKIELTQMSVSSEMYSSHIMNERTRQPHSVLWIKLNKT